MAQCFVQSLAQARAVHNFALLAAPQEEFLLGALMALAISALLAALKAENGQDYVYACFFLISVRCALCTAMTPCTSLQSWHIACPGVLITRECVRRDNQYSGAAPHCRLRIKDFALWKQLHSPWYRASL